MNVVRKFLLQTSAVFLFFSSPLLAASAKQYPNASGTVLFQTQGDRIMNSNVQGIPSNNAFIYIEPNISLNFNKNWSIKTDWRLQPNNVLTTRDKTYPERYRTFLQQDRGISGHDSDLIIEELKLHFQNDDLKFFLGKFDPTFGTAYNKAKRIGVFTAQFTEDYNLREKIGGGITALLEDSKITVNTFFNDTTALSQGAINNRKRDSRTSGVAGNTGTLSSYSISMDGQNLFGVEDLVYNVGYRNLAVDKAANSKAEQGYVFGSEYLYQVSLQSAIIPFFEVSKINNFTGQNGRNALYTTTALIGKYNNWNSSISYLTRNISSSQAIPKVDDHQLQFSLGYKFTNNVTLDVSRATIKENTHSAQLIGFVVGYLYQF